MPFMGTLPAFWQFSVDMTAAMARAREAYVTVRVDTIDHSHLACAHLVFCAVVSAKLSSEAKRNRPE